ncbi:hypothetical protein HDU76_006509, partial [Blyttiomyces sp. JEL0837]
MIKSLNTNNKQLNLDIKKEQKQKQTLQGIIQEQQFIDGTKQQQIQSLENQIAGRKVEEKKLEERLEDQVKQGEELERDNNILKSRSAELREVERENNIELYGLRNGLAGYMERNIKQTNVIQRLKARAVVGDALELQLEFANGLIKELERRVVIAERVLIGEQEVGKRKDQLTLKRNLAVSKADWVSRTVDVETQASLWLPETADVATQVVRRGLRSIGVGTQVPVRRVITDGNALVEQKSMGVRRRAGG